jgi:UTP--glucose-1-phosphate uridylyltransferase
MLPLGTRPTIQGVAEELLGASLRDILIVTGRQKRAIEDHFDPSDGLVPERESSRCAEVFDASLVRFYYTRQSEPKGLGDAVAHASQFAGRDHFVVALGDCLIIGAERSSLLKRMLVVHEERQASATIAVQTVPPEATSKYGIVAPEGDIEGDALKLCDILEKPGPEKAPSDLAVCARYVFSPILFDFLAGAEPGYGGEIQLTDAIRAMILDGRPVYAVPLSSDERRLDVGDFETYAQSFMRVMLADPELGPGLRQYAARLVAELDNKETAGKQVK